MGRSRDVGPARVEAAASPFAARSPGEGRSEAAPATRRPRDVGRTGVETAAALVAAQSSSAARAEAELGSRQLAAGLSSWSLGATAAKGDIAPLAVATGGRARVAGLLVALTEWRLLPEWSSAVLPLAFVLLWSSAYVAGAIATSWIAPLTVTLWRFVLASLLLGAVAWARGERWPRGRRELLGAGVTGVLLFAVQFGGIYLGLSAHMPAATTALIACSSPLVVACLSGLFGWERLSARQGLGIALGVIGVVVTLSDRLGRPPSAAALLWALLGLVGLVAGTLLQARLRMPAGPAALASVELAAASFVMALVAPHLGSLAIPLTLPALSAFAYVAIVAGAGAPLLFFALIRQRGPTQASSLLFVVPALTALMAWPLLGNRVGMTAVAGLLLAALGLQLSRRSPAALRREAPAVDAVELEP